jgi:mannan endo-1,4-beta-mannosidase
VSSFSNSDRDLLTTLRIPLVDNYNWYHGGKYQFIGWDGIEWSGTGAAITPSTVGAYFYNTTSM